MAREQTDAMTALVYELMAHLKSKISDLEVLSEFPEPNLELSMPTVSIQAGQPEYRAMDPYQFVLGDVVDHLAPLKTVIGAYDTVLQLDLWTGSKPERGILREKVIQALNPRSLEGISGLGLKLSRYHDSWANLTIDGIGIDDSEASSQRSEWRSTINVLANCRAIATGDTPVIEETELQMQTTEFPINETDVDFETE